MSDQQPAPTGEDQPAPAETGTPPPEAQPTADQPDQAPPPPAKQTPNKPEPTGPWADAGRKPISDAAPAGESVRYEDRYQAVLREIEKLDSIVEKTPDWYAIQQTGQELLTTKTKDLTLAAYATLALFHREGYAGLVTGLDLCSDMLENFWETLWPEKKRLRARVNALDWLNERTGAAVRSKEPAGSEKEAIHACKDAVDRLNTVADAAFGNDGPSLADVKRSVRQRVSDVGPLVAEPAPGQQASAQAGQPASAADVGTGEINSADDARTLLLKASGLLRQFSPTESICYRLPRAANWARVKALPPNEGGKTKIPGVHAQRREALAKLHDEGNWEVLLNSVETVFPESLFWLDLQRFADAALGGLGETYADARRAVRDETRQLLRRLPGLESLSFQDGTTFADPATGMWIESELMTADEAESAAGGSPKPSQDGQVEAALKEAKSLASGGQFPQAIELLQDGVLAAANTRERFLWQLELAKLCLMSGYAQLAGPILERLDEEVVRHSLEEWEPQLSLEVVRLRYQIAKRPAGAGKQPSPEAIKRVEELFSRLCRLDVAAALTLEGGEKK